MITVKTKPILPRKDYIRAYLCLQIRKYMKIKNGEYLRIIRVGNFLVAEKINDGEKIDSRICRKMYRNNICIPFESNKDLKIKAGDEIKMYLHKGLLFIGKDDFKESLYDDFKKIEIKKEIENIYKRKIGKSRYLILTKEMKEKMKIKNSDFVEFLKEDDNIIIKKTYKEKKCGLYIGKVIGDIRDTPSSCIRIPIAFFKKNNLKENSWLQTRIENQILTIEV